MPLEALSTISFGSACGAGMTYDGMLAVTGTGLGLIAFSSIPAVSSVVLRLSKKEKNNTKAIYEDGDGKATPESIKAFSAKPAKGLILALAAIGVALSIVIAVLFTKGESSFVQDVLSMAAWVCSQSSTQTTLRGQTDVVLRLSSCFKQSPLFRAGNQSKPMNSASTHSFLPCAWPLCFWRRTHNWPNRYTKTTDCSSLSGLSSLALPS